jgi:RNA polymerase sigma factor (sigma-70 family)
MANAKTPPVTRFLRQIAAAAPAGELADAQLLERFLTQRNEAAFATLVRRHGPMVLGVCRRVLHDSQHAEDAFQATFLVLIRKAGSLHQPNLLASWLYGVAYRTARKARDQVARRRARERPVTEVALDPPVEDLVWGDLRSVLEEEVQRLPARYRVPVLLCYLQGQTNQAAARQLGVPEGTLKGRLMRARELLRARLTRRGLVLSAGALVAALTDNAAAAVPPALAAATSQLGPLIAAGQPVAAGAVAPRVLHLTQGVLRAMTVSKLKNVGIAALLALAVVLTGVELFVYSSQAAGPASVGKSTSRTTAGKLSASGKKPKAAAEEDESYELRIQKERSLNNMKFFGLAMHKYHDDHRTFPPAALFSAKGKPLLSWRVLLLPYLGKEDLYKQFKLDEPWDSDHNKKLLEKMPDIYAPVLGKTKQPFATYYQALTGAGTGFEGKKGLRIPTDFPDGTSNTILIVEAGEAVPWTKPVDLAYEPKKALPKLGGMFKDGFHVTLADGGARFVKRSISEKTLRNAITRNDGQRLGKDWE